MREKILQWRRERAALADQMTACVEDNAKWQELDVKQEALRVKIEAAERTEKLQDELAKIHNPERPNVGDVDGSGAPVDFRSTKQYEQQFWKHVRFNNVAPEQRTYSPMGEGSGASGATFVPTGFQKEIELNMAAIGGIRKVARILPTATGNPLPWPTADDVSNEGEFLAESGAISQLNPTTSSVTLNAYLASSKQVLVPIELLQDSAFNIQSFLAELFGLRLERACNRQYTLGTGSPISGLIAALVTATRGVTAVGSSGNTGGNETGGTTIGTDDFDNLIAKVDPVWRPNGQFMANQATWDNMRKVKDKYGRPIWQTGLAEGSPDRICGYPYVYNQMMDLVATSKKTVIFGDFSKYVVRDVLGFTLVRYNELYMTNHQVGFEAYMRTDGKLIQPNAFSYLVQASS